MLVEVCRIMGINYDKFMKFDRALKKQFKDSSAEAILDRKKEIAHVALESLVTTTPYKTGRAKSGWLVGLDEPPEGEPTSVQARDEKGRFSGGFKARKKVVIDSAKAASLDLMVIRNGARVINKMTDEKLFIVNNVPYIEELDDGTSTQAPNGMTDIADANVKSML